jgi:cytochrome c oxidase subunit 4
MAHHSAQHGHGVDHPPSEQAHAEAHHPSWKTYVAIGLILTIITAIEVSAYYIPAWETSRVYVPSMLILSTIKFVLVVMFYMHLKYDHKLFKVLFTGPFVVAALTILALMFLFGQLALRMGALN